MRRGLEITHGSMSWIETAATLVAGCFVLGIMVIGCLEVLSRGLVNMPIHGYLDIIEQTMIVIALFAVSYCQAHWGNVRMTLVINALGGRAKWLAETVALLAALCVVLILIRGSWLHFIRAWEIGGTTPEIGLPTWIGALIVPLALGILATRLLLQWLDALRLLLGNGGDPVCFPKLAESEDGREVEVEENESWNL
jgi:TRAP-type C4-dicarboxylate transport system permease small subunit